MTIADIFDKFGPALISTLASISVAISVYLIGRKQDKIKTAVDVHKEYYTVDFGKARRDAEKFMLKHKHNDWSVTDPYALPDPDNWREGHAQVVRFFHRLAVLQGCSRIDVKLSSRLFSRELGFWFAMAFHPMAARDGWWTKEDIFRLAERFGAHGGRGLLELGYRDGLSKIDRDCADETMAGGDRASRPHVERVALPWKRQDDLFLQIRKIRGTPP